MPLLTVICVTLLALFALFWLMVTQQNALSEHRERSQLETAVSTQVAFLSNNIRDYAMWSDAVEHLAGDPGHGDLDQNWANENIGPYLFNTKGYEHSFVVDDQGRTLYASRGDRQSDIQASALMPSDFAGIVARLEHAPAGVEERFALIAEVDGKPAVVAASVILPSLGEAYTKPFARRYLIFVDVIDQAFVEGIAREYGVSGLAFHAGAPPAGLPVVRLMSATKKPIGYLTWQQSRPGDRMRATYLPWLLMIAVYTIVLSLFICRRAWGMTRELGASEAAARHLANHDTLTGLPNRRSLRERGIRHPPDQPMAVLYLDLDGFKEVNDLFGHQAGDVLLREATERLNAIVGEKGMLARVGGDEFAMLITSADAHAEAIALTQKAVAVMVEPFAANQLRMMVSASVGVALGKPGQSVDDLSRYADVAMYAAKADGKNCWRTYEAEMDEGREVRKLLESELRKAVAAGDVDVLFQPIVDAREGAVKAVEALARWDSPTQGPVGPAIFIPIAEESGLIVKLGELVLRKACMAARGWGVMLSVNISPAQFWHGSLVEDILAILRDCDFPPDRLELEITEGYLLSRPDLAADVIRTVRSHGIRVALDDFGTGFASIGYLRRFELDGLKLDRSFVEFVDSNRESADVAKAVIGLSHALNLPITAEGVETDKQALFLTLAGCEKLQGWHYGRAESQSTITAMLAKPELIELGPPQLGIAS